MFMPSGVLAQRSGTDEYTMVAGNDGLTAGYSRGQFGTLAPDFLPFLPYGQALVDGFVSTAGFITFAAVGSGIPDADSTFERLTITGTFSDGSAPFSELRSSMNYVNDIPENQTRWSFNAGRSFVSGNTYQVFFQ